MSTAPAGATDPASDPEPLPRCAVVAQAMGEQGVATAAPVSSWLLLEQPGSWPRNAADRVLAETLPAEARKRLAVARRAGLRPLLLRRPGRSTPVRRRAVFVGSARPGGTWLERLEVSELAEVATIDLDAVAAGHPGHGQAVEEPLLLVCTHASRDLCCALDGRPLAAGLAQWFGEQVWECSHVGGDRFAGNLAVLPFGEYHGRVEPESGFAIAEAAATGRVRLDNFRGRTSYDGWQQAAEIEMRRRTRVLERDVVVCGPTHHDGGLGTVEVSVGRHRWRVDVQRRTAPEQPPSRCSARLIPIVHDVVRVQRIDPVVTSAESG